MFLFQAKSPEQKNTSQFDFPLAPKSRTKSTTQIQLGTVKTEKNPNDPQKNYSEISHYSKSNENILVKTSRKRSRVNTKNSALDTKNIAEKPCFKKLLKSITIKETIERVCYWKSISYPEFLGLNKNLVSKEEGAKIVKIKKKSLDDYLMFLRLGIASKYDFESNLNSSFNELRKMIRGITPRIHWNKLKDPDVESLLKLCN